MLTLINSKYFHSLDVEKFTLHPLNVHCAFPSLYNTLRHISISQNDLLLQYLQQIETSVLNQLSAKGQSEADQNLSDTLMLHLNYIKWEVFNKPFLCHVHKLAFEDVNTYKHHI